MREGAAPWEAVGSSEKVDGCVAAGAWEGEWKGGERSGGCRDEGEHRNREQGGRCRRGSKARQLRGKTGGLEL